jgi:hypothetical protein
LKAKKEFGMKKFLMLLFAALPLSGYTSSALYTLVVIHNETGRTITLMNAGRFEELQPDRNAVKITGDTFSIENQEVTEVANGDVYKIECQKGSCNRTIRIIKMRQGQD